MSNDHLDFALYYSRELGWPVFPAHSIRDGRCTCGAADCGSPGKHPRTVNGLHDAATDEATIREWWSRWPEANVALRTGIAFDVVDIDGQNGLDALNRYRADRPMTWGPEAVTGRGGWHLLHLPSGGKNRARIVDHVDYRGQSGYIIAPPSFHVSGRRYLWAPGAGPDEPLEPLPEWLRELVLPRPVTPLPTRTGATRGTGRASAYAMRALESELGRVALAPVGQRNDQLNRSAFALGQLVAGGALSLDLVVDRLVEAAARAGLTGREVEATITSGLRNGARQPRQVPA